MVGTRSKTKMTEVEKASCPECAQPDNENMVQCDICDAWFHFICVGVDKEIEYKDFMCTKCKPSMTEREDSRKKVVSEDEIFESPLNVIVKNAETVGIRRCSISSSLVSNGSKRNQKEIDIQLRRLEEEYKMNMAHIQRKYEIMNTFDHQDESDDEGDELDRHQANSVVADYGKSVEPNRIKNFREPNVAQQNNPAHSSRMNNQLRQEHIYARQITPQELPIFSGKSEEWPLFISCYENSTRLCGFSDDENLLRLQRALKGKALEYVGSRLTLPALVPQVIKTLRMLFGRPENIIQNLITKLRAGPSVNMAKLDTLVQFSLGVKNIVSTMEAANLDAHLCNPMLIQELVEKLPPQMRLEWAIQAGKLSSVNLTEFSNWLFNLAEAASSIINVSAANVSEMEKRKQSRVNVHEENIRHDKNKGTFRSKCYGCNGSDHFIAKCGKFEQLEYRERWAIVNERNLCRSCLKIHSPKLCRERKECGVNNCTAKHHYLLHKVNADKSSTVVAVHRMMTSNVLYRIVPIKIYGENKIMDEYAFLDEGSGPTLVEKSVLKELGLNGEKSELCLKWTDGSVRTEFESERINLKISPVGKHKSIYLLKNVRSVNGLDLPKQTLIFSELTQKYKHLRSVPVESYRNVKPRIIIGLDNIRVATPLKYKEGQMDEPVALKTRLGWTIYGIVEIKPNSESYSNATLQLHICECDTDASLNKLMKINMQLENEGVEQKISDDKDDSTVQKFVQRTGNKFTVGLLWRSENLEMPHNYEMALKRFICFERKLQREPVLKKRVKDHIESMLEKGYIRKLQENEVHDQYPRKWYLPIFVVRNPNKPEKIRLVWDAAAEYQGVSLNQYLHKGPDLVTPLINVLFNFRIGKIGISGDISEMFHRVAVKSEDVQSQRFFWRINDKQHPDVYVLQVMSFGASCSPSLAQCVKNYNAKEFAVEFPRAVESIIKRHYVDDMLDSVDTIPEAIQLIEQVKKIHSAGNFHIRNWMSNSKEVIAAIGEENDENTFCKASQKIENVVEVEKVLGMWWRTGDDVFTYNLKFTKATEEILSGRKLPTKRELLRLIMSIFDPLGMLSFYTIQMKILLQNVWRSGTEWDDTIPEHFSNEWFRWLATLKEVERLEVPRCYFKGISNRRSVIQLHIFVDASENAYATVAYFRIEKHGKVETAFVCSKAKVAPLRPVSIPRMELLAAVMGARLARTIVQNHDIKIESTTFWTDSRTVLQWLRSDPKRYKQFVMFRVAEIQEITDVLQWKYVPSKENAADLATKWVRRPEFKQSNPWFSGPSFICSTPEYWPKQPYEHEPSEIEINMRHVAVQVERNTMLIDCTRFSKWERLLRTMAYVRKFIERRVLHKQKIDSVTLTTEQLVWSQQFLIHLIQHNAYKKEIVLLEQDNSSKLPNNSSLKKLSPFLDNNKIIRLRGRLENATVIQNETKNPIILPRNHYITRLIVDWYHRKYKHVHHETVINEIFQKYHIPGLRILLRTVRATCQICRNYRAEPQPPEMGNLPMARMAAFTKAFSYVGVDFFGPFTVTVGRRNEKRYGAVFTCLTVRAVHIELVHSLNASSCIMAIRNFIARRGVPKQIYSDNGTNLKAAEKELREAYKNINLEAIQNEFITQSMKWTFIPPASPHMGGAWERMVRSIKTVLYQIITPDQRLNDERLYNLFLEVESIINSRPLTYISLETADQEALTPNHFLLGTSSGDKPIGNFEKADVYLRKAWRHTQLLANLFWKRWVAEVLPTMTRRTNWFHKVKPIEVGDVVIIVDPNLPRHCWPKGLINEIIMGKDNQVRSAIVKTARGIYHRPAAKLAVLDVKPKDCEF